MNKELVNKKTKETTTNVTLIPKEYTDAQLYLPSKPSKRVKKEEVEETEELEEGLNFLFEDDDNEIGVGTETVEGQPYSEPEEGIEDFLKTLETED